MGKTSIAVATAHAFLPQVDDLFFLLPLSQMDYLAQICEALLPLELPDVRRYFVAQRILLVVDGLAAWHWERLLEQDWLLNHAYLIATSLTAYPAWQGVVIEVPPLDEAAARKFFMATRGTLPAEFFARIFKAAGGVPAQMLTFTHLAHVAEPAAAASEAHIRRVWDLASAKQRELWLLGFLLGDLGLSLPFWGDFLLLQQEDVFFLVQQQVFVPDHETADFRFWLSPMARRFCRQKAPRVSLDKIAQAFVADDQSALLMWLTLLQNGLWQHLTLPTLQSLLDSLWREVWRIGLWERWAAVLTLLVPLFESDPYWRLWVAVELARVRRAAGYLAESRRELGQLIEQAGAGGFFDLYARALLEVAQATLYLEEWEAAYEAAEGAAKTFARLRDGDGLEAARLVRARAVLPTDPRGTLSLLTELSVETAAALALASEAFLRLGAFDQAYDKARQALEVTAPHTPAYGRALSVLAVTCRSQGSMREALDYQKQAVNILSLTPDLVGHARACNNLGVMYYDCQDYEASRSSWLAAQDLLLPLQDAAALQTVRTNLRLLDALGRPDWL